MKWFANLRLWLAFSLAILLTSTAAAGGPDGARTRETEHLAIQWVEGVSPEAVEAAAEQGESFYEAIHGLLGNKPARKIPVLLQGPAESPDRSERGYPHVDSFGRIHLFQYGGRDSSYLSALAHEMVHVFRFDRRRDADWFFEEGFAEFVALTIDPSLSGFPWYDTPVEIAAGQWIAAGEDLSLLTLRREHRTLNLPCKAQSYSLRSAFFYHLGSAYGAEALLEMARRDSAGALSDYLQILGKDFKTLESEWRESALETYRSIEDVESRARRYREETPIQYMPVCD